MSLAIAIFIGYMIPEFGRVKDLNAEYATNQQALAAVKDKKIALEKLSSQIKSNEDSGVVYDYLPADKVEERIIGGINYLTTDAAVSLANISVKAAVDAQSSSNASATPTDPTTELTGLTAPSSVQTTQATVTVKGDYEKIKNFINGVQHMPLMNSIKSLNITAVEGTETEPASLTAVLVIDFSYLKSIKADNAKLANFKPEIDNTSVESLKSYISKSVPKINAAEVGSGRTNPFLP